MAVAGQEHIDRLTPSASHGEVQRHVAAFLEAVLQWELSTEEKGETGTIDSLPIGPADRPIPVFVIEYKSGNSSTLDELENKPGSQREETALEQLVRYMTEERMTLFGLLADASRLAVYANPIGTSDADPILHILWDDVDEDDIRSLKSKLPLAAEPHEQLEIRDDAEFVEFLAETIDTLRDPFREMLEDYEPEEFELLEELLPIGISKDEFAGKTAASLVSKLLLIRALEDQNDRFGAIINPTVAKSFGSSEYGFIVLAHSAYELAGTKFPDVFKADIDLFDWWLPANMISSDRRSLRGHFRRINTRLFTVLQRLWAYRIRVGRDLMGLAYQELRTSAEATILGAYFTPPELTEFTIETLIDYLQQSETTLDPDDLVEATGHEHKIIDVTCGSGTFLVSLASELIARTSRAPRDAARELITRLHGVDIDPLAVLMARSQLYGALAEHLDDAPSPNIFWQNALSLFDPPDQQIGLFEEYPTIGTAIEEAREDTEKARETVQPGRFSFVIGNPPWGRRSQIGRRMKDAGIDEDDVEDRLDNLVGGSWEDWFEHRDDNLLAPFVEIGAQLLDENGVLALVLDARFIAAEWGERVIERLERSFENVWVLDVSEEREFRYSASYPAIVLAQKKASDEE